MNHDPARLQAVVQATAPDLELSFRPMFGGIMGYAGGRVFASLSNVGLALKMAGDAHEALSTLPGAAPLRYEPDQPASKSYVVVPDAMLSKPEILRQWIDRCVADLKPPAKKPRKS